MRPVRIQANGRPLEPVAGKTACLFTRAWTPGSPCWEPWRKRASTGRRLAHAPVALASLRVCVRRSERNCGRCEKCLRTMVELHLAGALDSCTEFEQPLDLAAVASTSLKVTGAKRRHWERAQLALGDRELDRRLAAAIELALLKADLKEARARAGVLEERLQAAGIGDAASGVRPIRQALRAAVGALEPLAAAAFGGEQQAQASSGESPG